MQAKTFIIITIVAGIALVIFNLTNSYHDPDPISAEIASTEITNTANTSDDIANKPLGQQPKAMLDKANNEIDKVQQLENEKMAEIENMQ